MVETEMQTSVSLSLSNPLWHSNGAQHPKTAQEKHFWKRALRQTLSLPHSLMPPNAERLLSAFFFFSFLSSILPFLSTHTEKKKKKKE